MICINFLTNKFDIVWPINPKNKGASIDSQKQTKLNIFLKENFYQDQENGWTRASDCLPHCRCLESMHPKSQEQIGTLLNLYIHNPDLVFMIFLMWQCVLHLVFYVNLVFLWCKYTLIMIRGVKGSCLMSKTIHLMTVTFVLP